MLSADAYREDEERGLSELSQELAPGARLVAVDAVMFQTGFRMPLRKIADACHAAGAELFVDAIQALGVVPIDVHEDGVDFLACGSHKWLMSLDGIGFVFARSELQSSLEPRVAGWLSHEEPASFLLEGAGHLRYDRPVRKSISSEVYKVSPKDHESLREVHGYADPQILEIVALASAFDFVNRFVTALSD